MARLARQPRRGRRTASTAMAGGQQAPRSGRATFSGLSCSRTYQLGVDAADRTGNRSAKAQVSAVTLSCAPGDSPPPPHHHRRRPARASAARCRRRCPLRRGRRTTSRRTALTRHRAPRRSPGRRSRRRSTRSQPASGRSSARGTYTERPGHGSRRHGRGADHGRGVHRREAVLTSGGGHPLVISSTGAYFRFRGFLIQNSPGTSGGNVDIYGHHIEISDNEIRTAPTRGSTPPRRAITRRSSELDPQQRSRRHPPEPRHLPAGRRPPRREQPDPRPPEGFGIQVYDKGDRAIVTGNTITGAGHSGIVVGGSGGVSGVRVHNNVLAFNSRTGISHDSSCPTSSVADHNVTFSNSSGSTQRLLRPQLRGRQPRPGPAVRQLRGRNMHCRRQPCDRLRAAATTRR